MPPFPPFEGRLLTAPEDMAPFLTDWRRQCHGAAIAVAQPDTTDAVAALVRHCAEHAIPVVPQGGNTGLAGGATPDTTGRALVLSLARMTRVRAIDADNNTLTAEAGATLQAVQDAAAEAERLFPLSLASQGSCTIGGNLATNAGGTAVLRYGNARELCLGLEVVTAEGRVWDGLRGLRKDNTGLDLRDLFIGAEGTLGVITAAVLKLFPQPAGAATALTAVPSPGQAVRLLGLAQAALGPALTTFELISRPALDSVLRHFPAPDPLAAPSPWYVLMECSDWNDAGRAQTILTSILETAIDDGAATDAVIANSVAQAAALWRLREQISDSQAREGASVKHDIAVPISRIPAFIAQATPAVENAIPGARVAAFGHAGDGNLHFNVMLAEGFDHAAQGSQANAIVHDLADNFGGSISAEHGLGTLRAAEVLRYKSPVELDMLRAVRHALDPRGIMNPGKGIGGPSRQETGHPP